MKKILLTLLVLLPFSVSAQVIQLWQGGIGTTTAPTNWFLIGSNAQRLTATGTPFFDMFSFRLATGTSATTTNHFSTTASSTNLFSTSFNFGTGIFGNASSTNFYTSNIASSTSLFSQTLKTGTLTTTGLSSLSSLSVVGNATLSSTLTDSLASVGTSGYVLMTTGSGIQWVDAATSTYSNASSYKKAADYATIAALPANNYANGASGVGATISEIGVGALSVDGASPAVGNRVLVKNEGTAANNGIYTVTAAGSGIAAFVLTRATDYNTPSDVTPGVANYVVSGNTLDDSTWVMTSAAPITIGTTALNYSELGVGGSEFTAGSVLYSDGTLINQNNASFFWRNALPGLGLGTSTPQWTLQVASSTRAQLALSDGIITDNHWTFRNAGGQLYFATSSPVGNFATSTAVFSIDSNGLVNLTTGLLTLGSTTLQNFTGINATTTNATSTAFFATTASTSNWYLGVGPCTGGNALNVVAGRVTCGVVSASAANVYDSKWATSSPDILAISPNVALRVGIGTTTPQWALQIASSTGPQLTISDGLLTSDHWSFRNKGGNFYLATSSPGTFATSSFTAFSIIPGGNAGLVGFGTATPTVTLNQKSIIHVYGNNAGMRLQATTTTSSAQEADLTIEGSRIGSGNDQSAVGAVVFYNNANLISEMNGIRDGSDTSGAYQFLTTHNGGTLTERMRIGSYGQVGIGTTTPRWLLQLATSTAPQLTLSDGSLTSNHWSFRNAGGSLYIATSSPGNFATSSYTAFSIDTTGFIAIATTTLAGEPKSEGLVIATSTVITNGQLAVRIASTTGATTYTIDWNSGNTQRVIMDGNKNFIINATSSHPTDGGKYTLKLCQDSSGSRTTTYITPGQLRWWNGTTTPSATANTCTFIGMIYDANAGLYAVVASSTNVLNK